MLVVTHGTDGDVVPFVRLGRTLREAGHDVTLLTHAPYESSARRAGLDFVATDTSDEYERQLADTAVLLTGHGPRRWLDFYENNGLFEQILLEYREIAARHVPGRTVVIGRHTSAISALMAAEGLGVPTAWLALSPVQIMGARGARHLYATTLSAGLQRVRSAARLGPVQDWTAWLESADLELGLWPAWFDRAGVRSPAGVRLTGFPLADDRPRALPAAARELLDGPVRPVLVTGGTGRMLHPRFYKSAVEGCRRAGRPTLLVVPYRGLVPEPLPANVRWFPSLPFHEVMPKVGTLVHHGGIGTAARALAAGAHQVILAHGVDRPDNAERLEALGLARWLPVGKWDANRIAELIGSGPSRAVAVPAAGDGIGQAARDVQALLGPRRPGHAAPLSARLARLSPRHRSELLRRLEARR
jgi:UDP:flavonoid glycosyltransferase YjiC (YdhE family)